MPWLRIAIASEHGVDLSKSKPCCAARWSAKPQISEGGSVRLQIYQKVPSINADAGAQVRLRSASERLRLEDRRRATVGSDDLAGGRAGAAVMAIVDAVAVAVHVAAADLGGDDFGNPDFAHVVAGATGHQAAQQQCCKASSGIAFECGHCVPLGVGCVRGGHESRFTRAGLTRVGGRWQARRPLQLLVPSGEPVA